MIGFFFGVGSAEGACLDVGPLVAARDVGGGVERLTGSEDAAGVTRAVGEGDEDADLLGWTDALAEGAEGPEGPEGAVEVPKGALGVGER